MIVIRYARALAMLLALAFLTPLPGRMPRG
jgi:hypothetical protein